MMAASLRSPRDKAPLCQMKMRTIKPLWLKNLSQYLPHEDEAAGDADEPHERGDKPVVPRVYPPERFHPAEEPFHGVARLLQGMLVENRRSPLTLLPAPPWYVRMDVPPLEVQPDEECVVVLVRVDPTGPLPGPAPPVGSLHHHAVHQRDELP